MFIKISDKYINSTHIIMVADSPNSTQGSIAVYIWGLKNPIHTCDYVSAESLTKKILKCQKTGEI